VDGEEPPAQGLDFLERPKRGVDQQAFASSDVEHAKAVPKGMTLDELIVRRNVEAAERPRQDAQAFETPGRIDLLLLIESARWALQDFPLVRFEFVINTEQADPREQILVLALPPGQQVPDPG
jgi:hypothetical protein